LGLLKWVDLGEEVRQCEPDQYCFLSSASQVDSHNNSFTILKKHIGKGGSSSSAKPLEFFHFHLDPELMTLFQQGSANLVPWWLHLLVT
jgi:hypothetical protein